MPSGIYRHADGRLRYRAVLLDSTGVEIFRNDLPNPSKSVNLPAMSVDIQVLRMQLEPFIDRGRSMFYLRKFNRTSQVLDGYRVFREVAP